MIKLALQLLIAHMIGDFLLQPDQWVKEKESKRLQSPYFYYHLLIHAVALLILLEFKIMEYWPGMLLILFTHGIIDLAKLSLKGKMNERLLFWLDQAAHLGVISMVVCLYQPYEIPLHFLTQTESLLLMAILLFLTVISAVIIKTIFNQWMTDLEGKNESLKDAGKYIGMLERLFVFVFILLGQWSAIGFLITAKSVFRFGDLSKADDRKLTEYILLGTFLSFGLAILASLIYQHLSLVIHDQNH